ncbi:MAG: hypothetical protein KDK62_04020 [Chlamydiia bacterium]|nr:hypothetical protein [Chlamydiia bacterium]
MKKIVLGALGLLPIAVFFLYLEGFREAHLHYDVPKELEWQAENASVEAILSQPFTYLDKGSQSYAFVDPTGNIVIKFLKFKHLKPPLLWQDSPRQKARKERKLRQLFDGYKTAFERHKEASGLLYVHLAKGGDFKKLLEVKGPWGETHFIDLSQIYFVIQKRGVSLEAELSRVLQDKHPEIAEEKILKMLGYYLDSYQKGLFDKDHALLRNTGFQGDEPLHFDVGMLVFDPKFKEPDFYEHDIEKNARAVAEWLDHAYPGYAKGLTRSMEAYLEKRLSRPITLESRP